MKPRVPLIKPKILTLDYRDEIKKIHVFKKGCHLFKK